MPDSGVSTAAFTTLDGLTIRLKLFEADKKDWVVFEASGSETRCRGGGESGQRLGPGSGRLPFRMRRPSCCARNMADLLVVPAGGS